MNRVWSIIRFIGAMAMLAALATAAMSCSSDSGDRAPDDGSKPKEVFQLKFQICSRISDSDSRADGDAEGATDIVEEGSAAENMLNVNDISYYLFDRQRKFLFQLKPEATVTTKISEDYAIYEVVAKIGNDDDPSDYFKRNWHTQTDFYILALANYSGYASVMPKLNAEDTLDALMDGKKTVLSSMPDTKKILEGGSSDGKGLIPMAGLQLFSINGSWFETQTGEAPIDLTFLTGKKLNMLRAVAKLEVIDMINHKSGTVYDPSSGDGSVRISGVTINGVMKDALLLPTANQWIYNNYGETRQVQNASVTASGNYVSPPAINSSDSPTEGSFLNFVYDERETARRDDRCPVYSCYVWEYLKSDGIPANRTPYLGIKVHNALNAPTQTSEDTDVTYRISLCNDMSAGATEHIPVVAILRNHIYRYEIVGTETGMSIDWSVCPMDKASANITFN